MGTPLADKIRPKTLKDFVGQRHLVGKDKPIKLAIQQKNLHSLIFWGPPGVGKTTLARIIAYEIKANFFPLSAVSAGKKDVKAIIEREKKPGLFGKAVLFLDEIHRFNKAQQDFLLPYVETGTIILIGATTENPSFEIISALLSRSQVFVLNPLSEPEMSAIITRAARALKVKLAKKPIDYLIQFASGDARQAINLLEVTAKLYKRVTLKNLKTARWILVLFW